MNPSETKGNEEEVRAACAVLFSPEISTRTGFIEKLDLEILKKAYRLRAKECHPDLHPHGKEASGRFLAVQSAYELLTAHLLERAGPPFEKPSGRARIVAIGGAKGGIGKSLFSVNLAIHLSNQGYKVVVADLDLGNANLHLYFGNRSLPKKSIHDYLRRRVESLDEVMVKTSYGPRLIGGDSSETGAANIEFAKKLRLLRALRGIDADFLILDLGGDTNFNILDFFLIADCKVVLTTRDSASYIGAYHFIKAALYRRLNRLFGPESNWRNRKDEQLEKMIREATTPQSGSEVRTVGEFVERVSRQLPRQLPFIQEVLADFRAYLLLNKIPNGSSGEMQAAQVVQKLRAVTKKWLSKDIEYAGSLTFQSEVESSAIDLVPTLARHPRGRLAKEMEAVAGRLFAAR